MRSRVFVAVVAVMLAAQVVPAAAGQAEYPNREIEFIVSFPPGGPADTAARAVVALARAGAREEELVAFRQSVERDIALGAPAGASATVRVTAVGRELSAIDQVPASSPPTPPRPRRP